jgi:hypothetical protein
MPEQKDILVKDLLLDLGNYRHGQQPNQTKAREAIIKDQGKKLIRLAEDILAKGLSPADLLMVTKEPDTNNYTVLEGNRRLTVIQLLLNPELAQSTSIYKKFKKLHTGENISRIPRSLRCVLFINKEEARPWIDRKHSTGLEGAGTETWTAIAKARSDQDAGKFRPSLSIIDFILSELGKDDPLHEILNNDFNLTTLDRLVNDNYLKTELGINIKGRQIEIESDPSWLRDILVDLITIIGQRKYKGEKFVVGNVYTDEERKEFINLLLQDHPKKRNSEQPWVITSPDKEKTKNKQDNLSLNTENRVDDNQKEGGQGDLWMGGTYYYPPRSDNNLNLAADQNKRKTKRRNKEFPEFFGESLSLQSGSVNDLYRDILDLYDYYLGNKNSLSQNFHILIRMALRLLVESAAKDNNLKLNNYTKQYFGEAKKLLSQDKKTQLHTQNVSEERLDSLLHIGAHNYEEANNFDQTVAMSLLIGKMLILSHGKKES